MRVEMRPVERTRVSCLTPAVGSAGLSRPAGGTGRGFTRRSRPSARAALRLSAAIRRPHPLPPVPLPVGVGSTTSCWPAPAGVPGTAMT